MRGGDTTCVSVSVCERRPSVSCPFCREADRERETQAVPEFLRSSRHPPRPRHPPDFQRISARLRLRLPRAYHRRPNHHHRRRDPPDMSSSRKPLIRSSSDRPTTMRNWPLFVFLIGLVLFFYIFYVYQAQGAALAQVTEESRQLSSQLSLTKGKLVGSLADLETSNSDKKSLTSQLDEVTKKNDECMSSLRNTKLRVDTLEKDGKSNTENYTKVHAELEALKKKAEELERNNTALTSMVSTQQQLITQLNQTIGIIKFEKEELKNAASLTPKVEKTEKPELTTPKAVPVPVTQAAVPSSVNPVGNLEEKEKEPEPVAENPENQENSENQQEEPEPVTDKPEIKET